MENLAGTKFRIGALGCRTNQYEAEAIASGLILRGAVPSEDLWDVAILLTCTVTAEADRKCRQQVRRLRRENPQGIIVAVGCWAQELDEGEASRIGLDGVVGNRLKSALPKILEGMIARRARPEKPVVLRLSSPPAGEWDNLSLSKPTLHTRAFIKVQDGCDHFCSYCIVPFVRGHPLSRDPADILAEVESVASSGCREVVLTGVHLGLFRMGDQWDLARLVEAISEIPEIMRIRFGSIEPFALDEKLITTLVRTPKFCPHLHIPMQSGDDGILSAMRRGYDSAGFGRVIERIRELWPGKIHLSTDILVGFPGETDEAYRRTLNLVQALGFGKLHVFPYSRRPGTAAASFGGHLSESVKKARCEEAILLGTELLGRFASVFSGKTVPALVERAKGGQARGLTPHFLPIRWTGTETTGQIRDVLVKGFENGELLG
jgi:threonylcarbamoyladenosine tRNA methylthiotransferase MtaB